MVSARRSRTGKSMAHVFPPALVPILQERFARRGASLAEVADDVLIELLTTIFFAGLETYEGERNPVGVAFFGKSPVDFVIAQEQQCSTRRPEIHYGFGHRQQLLGAEREKLRTRHGLDDVKQQLPRMTRVEVG